MLTEDHPAFLSTVVQLELFPRVLFGGRGARPAGYLFWDMRDMFERKLASDLWEKSFF